MWKRTLFNVAKFVLLAFFIYTIKPLVATRPLDSKKASNATMKVSFQEDTAAVPPSGPNPWTHIPGPSKGH